MVNRVRKGTFLSGGGGGKRVSFLFEGGPGPPPEPEKKKKNSKDPALSLRGGSLYLGEKGEAGKKRKKRKKIKKDGYWGNACRRKARGRQDPGGRKESRGSTRDRNFGRGENQKPLHRKGRSRVERQETS